MERPRLRPPVTAIDSIRQYLALCAHHGDEPARFLLLYGTEFAWEPNVESSRLRGRARDCYRNALVTSWHYGLTYVEGVAFNGTIPCGHAWCLDVAGRVIEPTWPDPGDDRCGFCLGEGEEEDDEGERHPCEWCERTGVDVVRVPRRAYFGIPVEADLARATVLRNEHFGVLDTHIIDYIGAAA